MITTPPGRVGTATQTLAGTGEAGSTVALYDGTMAMDQTALVGADGKWSTTVQLPEAGTHSITAVDTDLAGNRGTSAAVTLTYDHAPEIVSGGGGLTAVYNVGIGVKQVATIQAVDGDAGDRVKYALLGADGKPAGQVKGFVIDAASGVLSFTGKPAVGLHNVTVVATDSFGATAVQNVKVNVAGSPLLGATSGQPTATQTYVVDPAQRLTLLQSYHVADWNTKGVITPHSVLSLAHSLFNGATTNASPGQMANILASHTVQSGTDTLLRTDRGTVINLLGISRQNLLAHPNAVAFT